MFASGSNPGLFRSSNTEFTIRTFIRQALCPRSAVSHVTVHAPRFPGDRHFRAGANVAVPSATCLIPATDSAGQIASRATPKSAGKREVHARCPVARARSFIELTFAKLARTFHIGARRGLSLALRPHDLRDFDLVVRPSARARSQARHSWHVVEPSSG